MSTVVFIAGLNSNDAGYNKLNADIAANWQPKLPAGTRLIMDRWDKDVLANIVANVPPTTKLVLVGFSFGGQKAVEVAEALKLANRNVSTMVLIDPVNWHSNTGPNPGFALPSNVLRAFCFYREAKQSPWSGPIKSAACEFTNKRYVPTTPDVLAAHGQYVWNGETAAAAKTGL